MGLFLSRLMHELNGWVMGHKEEVRKKEEAMQQKQQRREKKERRLRRKKYLAPHTLNNAVGGAVGDLRYKDRYSNWALTVSVLTDWGQDKMATILQITFSNAFSSIKIIVFHYCMILAVTLRYFCRL